MNIITDTASLQVSLCTPSFWRGRQFKQQKPLLGPWLMAEARYLVWGDRGSGKSAIMLGGAHAGAAGASFGSWKAERPVRTIYLDGEMSRRDMRTRMEEFGEHFDDHLAALDENLLVWNTVDLSKFTPLDEPKRAARFVDAVHDFDAEVVWIDNIQCLVSRSIKDGAAFDGLQGAMMGLRAIKVAEVWGHHAGFSNHHFYGDSRIDWGMAGSLKCERDATVRNKLKVAVTTDKPFRELRGDGNSRIPQTITFDRSAIAFAGVEPSTYRSTLQKIVSGWSGMSETMSELRKAFLASVNPDEDSDATGKFSHAFERAVKGLQDLKKIKVSDDGETWRRL